MSKEAFGYMLITILIACTHLLFTPKTESVKFNQKVMVVVVTLTVFTYSNMGEHQETDA